MKSFLILLTFYLLFAFIKKPCHVGSEGTKNQFLNPQRAVIDTFWEEDIFDTIGEKYSNDLVSILGVLNYYEIKIPYFKYSYILKVHNDGGGVYDNFILRNDTMSLFRTSFNRNMTPNQIVYYNMERGRLDSSIYQFIEKGRLEKIE